MVFIGIVYSSCMYSSSLSTASKGSPARPLVGLGAASAAAPRFLHRLAILHTPNSLHQSTNLQFEVLNNYYWDCCLSVFFSRVLYLYILKAAAPLYYNFLGVSTSLKKKICGLLCYVKMFLWNNSPNDLNFGLLRSNFEEDDTWPRSRPLVIPQ